MNQLHIGYVSITNLTIRFDIQSTKWAKTSGRTPWSARGIRVCNRGVFRTQSSGLPPEEQWIDWLIQPEFGNRVLSDSVLRGTNETGKAHLF
jgi:hypothetical protein